MARYLPCWRYRDGYAGSLPHHERQPADRRWACHGVPAVMDAAVIKIDPLPPIRELGQIDCTCLSAFLDNGCNQHIFPKHEIVAISKTPLIVREVETRRPNNRLM